MQHKTIARRWADRAGLKCSPAQPAREREDATRHQGPARPLYTFPPGNSGATDRRTLDPSALPRTTPVRSLCGLPGFQIVPKLQPQALPPLSHAYALEKPSVLGKHRGPGALIVSLAP